MVTTFFREKLLPKSRRSIVVSVLVSKVKFCRGFNGLLFPLLPQELHAMKVTLARRQGRRAVGFVVV